ncbi:hypothetical protein LOC68_00140 [Blastopirellula sp. JC732]|uniref:Uncharacterized protein n=1 Tax=Blastopirellula sediminis TaxID=2894196 RepID=A0A9X1SEG7_9BACT|nr:hypothetical protein [Blastopirellula sediminis]MCC9604282.1 hypothetical protein [Blastopirellula sediminis]MCC9626802.1 hypothetical protein [Blastopirellula sediminis]
MTKRTWTTCWLTPMLAVLSLASFAAAQEFSTSDTNVGYIDSAFVGSKIRFRFDSAYDNPTPDRAEFFYRASTAATGSPISPAEPQVDYQEFWTYLELAVASNVSLFVDAPVRMVNPEIAANTSGFSDLQVGIKGILLESDADMLTGQIRVYTPTGDASRRLGTNHASIEPALLYARRLSDRTMLESEFRVWVPLDSTVVPQGHFAGPVLRYGVGVGHDLYQCVSPCGCESKKLTAVAEFVGWSILDGLATVPATPTMATIIDVDGDTIINGKFGLRYTQSCHSVYVGYGRAFTGDVWYHDIIRAEYAIRF